MRLFLFVISLILSFSVSAQDPQVTLDSLLIVEQEDKLEGEELVDFYNTVAYTARYIDYDLCVKYARKADKLSESIDFPKGRVDAHHHLGSLSYYNAEFDSCLHFNRIAIRISMENNLDALLARSYNNVAVAYDDLGELDSAVHYAMMCLKINEELDDYDGMASANLELGNVYYQQGIFEEALKYFKAALVLDEAIDYKSGMAYDYGNIGSVYERLGEVDSAIMYLNKCAKIREEIKEYHSLAITYINLANVNRAHISMDSAQLYLDKAAGIIDEIGDRDVMSHLYASIAMLQKDHFKDFILAEEYGLKALDLAREIKSLYREIEALQILTNIYELKGEYKEAVAYWKKYQNMHDSLVNTQNSQMLADMKLQYEDEKHQLQIQSLEEQKETNEKLHKAELEQEQIKSNNQEKIIYIMTFGLLVLAILGFIAYRSYQQKKKANVEIILQKHLVEEKNKEITDSITYAKRIQSAILPPAKEVEKHLPESFILYKPKDIVAGDFYWLEPFQNEKESESGVLFAACDCTGHGVPGAMVSVVCNNGLNRAVREYGLLEPSKVLDKTRDLVTAEFEKSEEEVKDGMDIALCSLTFAKSGKQSKSGSSASSKSEEQARSASANRVLPTALAAAQATGDTQKATGDMQTVTSHSALLRYAGAHNPLWIVRADTSVVTEVKADKQPIGKYSHALPFTSHEIQLSKGDTIYIFSDGYADQFGGDKGKKLKASNFKNLLCDIVAKPMQDQKTILDKKFEEWKGEFEQLDDVCVIGVRV